MAVGSAAAEGVSLVCLAVLLWVAPSLAALAAIAALPSVPPLLVLESGWEAANTMTEAAAMACSTLLLWLTPALPALPRVWASLV